MSTGNVICLMSTFLVLMGCAVDPSADRPMAKEPDAHKAEPATQISTTLPETRQSPFTLAQCLDLALRYNPDLLAGRFNVEAFQADRDSLAGQRWPSLAMDAGYRSYLDDQRLVQPRYGNEPGVYGSDILNGDVILSMPLFTAGRIKNQIKVSDLLSQSATHRLTRTRHELVFNVSQIFYRILAQKHIVKSLDFSKQALTEHRRRVSHMMAEQKAARVDLLRTEVRLADIEQQRVAQANVLSILHQVLANLMGLSDAPSDLAIQGELALIPVDVNIPDARNRAYAQRADYLAMQKEVAAQESGLELARSGRWPVVSAEATYGLRNSVNPNSQPAGTDQTEDLGFVGVRALWPLFEGGAINARVRREQAKLLMQRQHLRKLKLQIDLDLETARANLTSAQQRVTATEASIAQAQESLRIEQELYSLGKGSMTDVLDAQSALLAAQTNYYHALSDTNSAKGQWHLALGDDL